MSRSSSMESVDSDGCCAIQGFRKLSSNYQLIKSCGSGGSGCVVQALRREDGLEVAIKMVNKKNLSPGMKRALAVEVQVLGMIEHEGAVHLVEYLEDSRYVYIVMEFVEGCDLYRQLKKMKRGFNEDEALRIVEGLLETLVYLHANGIAHRDLKLENIMFTDEYSMSTKLVDFGLASVKHDGDSGLSRAFCGTIQYCSPEVASKRPYVPESADMWGVGVVLYALIARKLPFFSTEGDRLQRAILNEDVHFSGAAWQKVSDSTKRLIRALLEKNPNSRPSAEQCLRLVRAILDGGEEDIRDVENLVRSLDKPKQQPMGGIVEAVINVLHLPWLQPMHA